MKDSLAVADELYMEFFSAICNIEQSKDCTHKIEKPETIKSLNEKFLRFAVAEVVAGNTPISIISEEIIGLIKSGELVASNVHEYVREDVLMYDVG